MTNRTVVNVAAVVAAIILLNTVSAQRANSCKKASSYWTRDLSKQCFYNPDVFSDVLSLAARHGYKAEALSATTKDGYILTVFRVRSQVGETGKAPIFIQHGISVNSVPWVDKGSERSIAFVLADRGHDVFLGNIRGSTYSRSHVTLKTDNREFWNYNLDILAEYDISAQLELVASVTGQAGRIVYIGHSMGTTLLFMHGSSHPQEFNSLVQGAIALAPIVYFKENPGIKLLTPLVDVLDLLRVGKIFYHEEFIHKEITRTCGFVPHVCLKFLDLLFGKSAQFPVDDLLLYYSSWPSTTSIRQFKQYTQLYNSKKFQKYNWGSSKNEELYGQKTPPEYDLGQFTTPVYLLYGKKDALTDGEHVTKVFNELGSTQKIIQSVPKDNETLDFSHNDFLYGEFLPQFLYSEIINILETVFNK